MKERAKSSSSCDLGALLYRLANMHDSGIHRFRADYTKEAPVYQRERYSDESLLNLRDELRLLWECDAAGKQLDLECCRAYAPDWNSHRGREHAQALSNMMSQFEEATVQAAICNMWLRSEKQPVAVIWTKQKKAIAPVRQCLPAVLALGCVQHAGHLKVCSNKHCAVPYFISKRKDQKYCSDDCAAPAKREAKRRWWTINRAKNAQQNLDSATRVRVRSEREERR
jgi:hypothetical protein